MKVKLSSLEGQDDFVLLAPGFSDFGGWTLLREARLVEPGATPEASVFIARYETPGEAALQLTGAFEAIDLELDVEPPPLVWSLDETGYVEQVEAIREAIATRAG